MRYGDPQHCPHCDAKMVHDEVWVPVPGERYRYEMHFGPKATVTTTARGADGVPLEGQACAYECLCCEATWLSYDESEWENPLCKYTDREKVLFEDMQVAEFLTVDLGCEELEVVRAPKDIPDAIGVLVSTDCGHKVTDSWKSPWGDA